LRVIKLVKPG